MAGMDVSKLVAFGLIGAPEDSLVVSKLVGFAILAPGSPPNAVAGSSSLTFDLESPKAQVFPLGVSGIVGITFSSPDVPIGSSPGQFYATGAIAGETSITFLLTGAFSNPASFPDTDNGLSRGGCPVPRLASAFCEERNASAEEECAALDPKLSSNTEEDRTASYYKEE